MTVDSSSLTRSRRKLLRWFDQNQRPLPWRDDRDPYRVLVSEIMLQQTTVATVATRFASFIQRFPTFADLARASLDDVLHEWQGLGYYRRARDLYRTAQYLVEHHAGQLPDDPAVVERLPGVGRYILGAVLSQAFERRLPIVEANSQRVYCRLFGQEGDPTSTPVRRWLWQVAEEILPRRRVGDFNQAVMELGALICTPRSPQCERCPLRTVCAARREGKQAIIPAKSKPKSIEEVAEVAVVVARGDSLLLAQRPDHGRWAGMWEFPHLPKLNGEQAEETAARAIAGVVAMWGGEIATIRHAVTRFRITMACLSAVYRSGRLSTEHYTRAKWFKRDELSSLAMSAPQRRLIACLRSPTLF
jgi:A/G-specific adenine glycosylase